MSRNEQSFADSGFALGLNEGCLGMLGTAILLVGAVLWSGGGPNVEKTDFSLTYVAATIVHSGLRSRLYDIALQQHVRDTLFRYPNPLIYEHPPFEALAFSPLAGLSFRTAYIIWGIVNAAVWLLLIFVLRPYLPRPREDLGYICLWLVFAPLGVALYQGQSSVLLLAFFAIAYVKLRRNKEFSAGFFLGFGMLKLQFVLPFVLMFLMRKKWRFLAGFVTTSCVLGLLSLVVVGWSGLLLYVRLLFTIGSNPQNLSYGSAVDMPTIYGLVYAISGDKFGHTGPGLIVALLSISMIVLIGSSWRSLEGTTSDLLFAAAIATSLVTGLHMFMHDFSPLLLAMFLTLLRFPDRNSALRACLLGCLIWFWMSPIYFALIAHHRFYLMCPVLVLFAISALLAGKDAGEITLKYGF